MKKLFRLIFVTMTASCLCALPAAAEQPFSIGGKITVTKVSDGDSLRSGRLKIRLHGIDAPELKQNCANAAGRRWACGVAARERLVELTSAPLKCDLVDVDRYGRLIMRCFSGRTDISKALVSQGLALAYREYSTDYVRAEETARRKRAGVWNGEFMAPWDWRRAN
jgi:endonuclease YncB( thermonuclease family)